MGLWDQPLYPGAPTILAILAHGPEATGTTSAEK